MVLLWLILQNQPGQKNLGSLRGPELALIPHEGLKEGAAAHTQIRPHLHSPSLSYPALCKLSQTAALPRSRALAVSVGWRKGQDGEVGARRGLLPSQGSPTRESHTPVTV